jgi:putative endonuclease
MTKMIKRWISFISGLGLLNFRFIRRGQSADNMKDSRAIGQYGEEIACRSLKRESYKILERNFRCRQGEIDIIAEDKDGVLCFVEVKARSSVAYGMPEEVVNSHKQKRLTSAAYIYIEKHKIEPRDMRFDIVSVDLGTGNTRILKNAFEVGY